MLEMSIFVVSVAACLHQFCVVGARVVPNSSPGGCNEIVIIISQECKILEDLT